MIGGTLSHYRILEELGRGGMGVVYKAEDTKLQRTVAIKILRSEIAKNPVLVERFQSEARAIARVDNENVLKIYDVGQEDGLYYMVVEFLDGEEVFVIAGPVDALAGPHRTAPMQLIVNLAVGGVFAGDRQIGRFGQWWGDARVPSSFPDVGWSEAALELQAVRISP